MFCKKQLLPLRARAIACVFGVSAVFTAAAQSTDELPFFKGYVTGWDADGTVLMNGLRLEVSPVTILRVKSARTKQTLRAMPIVFVGESVEGHGSTKHKSHSITVAEVLFTEPEPSHPVSGGGFVDRVRLDAAQKVEAVRVEGYWLAAAGATVRYEPPLSRGDALRTNEWVQFRGEQQASGLVQAQEMTVSANVVDAKEESLRKKYSYDPDSIPAEARQSRVSRWLTGVSVDDIAPWPDAAMQARVRKIGEKLIPQYQRNLPEGDPTRISFRFEVTDDFGQKRAGALPSGVILVPHDTVERLPDDSELAEVLAYAIAETLQKQFLHLRESGHRLSAVELATTAGGFLVPGLGLAGSLGTAVAGAHEVSTADQQALLTSLGLLADAGYPLADAPRAWWRLASRKPKPLNEIDLPGRSAVLYQSLASTWRTDAGSAGAAEETPATGGGAF